MFHTRAVNVCEKSWLVFERRVSLRVNGYAIQLELKFTYCGLTFSAPMKTFFYESSFSSSGRKMINDINEVNPGGIKWAASFFRQQ